MHWRPGRGHCATHECAGRSIRNGDALPLPEASSGLSSTAESMRPWLTVWNQSQQIYRLTSRLKWPEASAIGGGLWQRHPCRLPRLTPAHRANQPNAPRWTHASATWTNSPAPEGLLSTWTGSPTSGSNPVMCSSRFAAESGSPESVIRGREPPSLQRTPSLLG